MTENVELSPEIKLRIEQLAIEGKNVFPIQELGIWQQFLNWLCEVGLRKCNSDDFVP